MAEGVIKTEVIVSPLSDDLVEGDRVVAVTLVESPTGLPPAYTIGPEFNSGQIVIHDSKSDGELPPPDKAPIVSVIAWDAHAIEPSRPSELNTASFQIRRIGSVDDDLVVWLTVADTADGGTDYEALPKTLTIPANRSSIFLIVTPIDDLQVEPSETVTLVIVGSPVAPPIPPYSVGKEDRATVAIADSGWIFPGGVGYCFSPPNGLMHVCFAGADGARFRFEVSEDLAVWATVAYATALDGAVHLIDHQASHTGASLLQIDSRSAGRRTFLSVSRFKAPFRSSFPLGTRCHQRHYGPILIADL